MKPPSKKNDFTGSKIVAAARSKFVADASHELKQPMNALNLCLDALKELDTSPSVANYLDKIGRCAAAINDTLATLLATLSPDTILKAAPGPLETATLNSLARVGNTADRPKPTDIVIALIDDEQLVLDAMRPLLENWKYTVVTAANGRQAWDKLMCRERPPDIIICDYSLAHGECGINVIGLLRNAFQRRIPAFLVTGVNRKDYLDRISNSGLALIPKPLNVDELKSALAQSISQNHVQ